MGNVCCNERTENEPIEGQVPDQSKQSRGLVAARPEGSGVPSFIEAVSSTESGQFPSEASSWLGLSSNQGIEGTIEKYGLFKFETSLDSSLQIFKIEGAYSDGRKYRYFGQAKDGVMEGKGHMLLMDEGYLIVSEFVNRRAQGEGAIYFSNGDYFKGQVDNETMNNGILSLANGSVYEGSFYQNQFNWKGTMRFQDGRVYQGDFVAGKKQGRGVFTWPDGHKYDGEWFDGKQHGKGTFTSKAGKSVEGEFYEGKKLKLIE